MRVVALAMVPLLCAGAAFAQIQRGQLEVSQEVEPGCEQPVGRMATAKKMFVDNYQAAQTALNAADWGGVIGSAALARPHVIDGLQEQALVQLEVAAYSGLGNEALIAERIGAYLALPCTQPAIRKNYQLMLDWIEANVAARQPQ